MMEKEEITIIKPKKGIFELGLKELFKFKELFWALAMKEIKVRYKQTALGGLWAILQPLITMIVFTVFFGNVVKIPSDNIPYALFSYSGLLIWTYFSTAISSASLSTVANSQLISKVYFPRLIIPFSTTIVGLLDYVIAFIIIFGLMYYYNFVPSILILLVPIVLFFTWMLSAGMGFWFSAINVKYRDMKYAIPFFIRTLIFVTPVIYPVSITGNYKWILMLNPMSGFVEAHRSMILGHQPIDWMLFGISVVSTIIIFISGIIYFKSVEKKFADII
ncbi:MAG: ABC transporter permease [bacterium]